MVYIVIGLWLVSVCAAILYENYVSKEIWSLQKRVKGWDESWRKSMEQNSMTWDRTVNIRGELDTLAKKFEQLSIAQLERFDKFQKDMEFMRAHQHGMDKRIAGLKREVIVTINNAPEKASTKQKVTKSLLKRAGVTQ